jgi:hypothetical protein
LNHNNAAYWQSRGHSSNPHGAFSDHDGDDDPNHPYNCTPGKIRVLEQPGNESPEKH